MNYIVLNNKDFFKNRIKVGSLKEVSVNEEERVDAIFGKITKELLEGEHSESRGGNQFFRNKWLLKDRGVSFMVFEVNRGILYDENDQLIEEMFGLFSKNDFYIELWTLNVENSYNQLDCFLIIYNKRFGFQQIISAYNKQKDHFEMILEKIEEKIL